VKVNLEIPHALVQPVVKNRYLRARMSTQTEEDRIAMLCSFVGHVLIVRGMLGTNQAAMRDLIQLYMRSSSTH